MFSKHISYCNCQYKRNRRWVVVRFQIPRLSRLSQHQHLFQTPVFPRFLEPSTCWELKLADYPGNICPKGTIVDVWRPHRTHISQDGDGVEQWMLPVLPSFSIICSNHCSTFQKKPRSNLSCAFFEPWLKQTFQMHPRRGVQLASEASSFH